MTITFEFHQKKKKKKVDRNENNFHPTATTKHRGLFSNASRARFFCFSRQSRSICSRGGNAQGCTSRGSVSREKRFSSWIHEMLSAISISSFRVSYFRRCLRGNEAWRREVYIYINIFLGRRGAIRSVDERRLAKRKGIRKWLGCTATQLRVHRSLTPTTQPILGLRKSWPRKYCATYNPSFFFIYR